MKDNKSNEEVNSINSENVDKLLNHLDIPLTKYAVSNEDKLLAAHAILKTVQSIRQVDMYIDFNAINNKENRMIRNLHLLEDEHGYISTDAIIRVAYLELTKKSKRRPRQDFSITKKSKKY